MHKVVVYAARAAVFKKKVAVITLADNRAAIFKFLLFMVYPCSKIKTITKSVLGWIGSLSWVEYPPLCGENLGF